MGVGYFGGAALDPLVGLRTVNLGAFPEVGGLGWNARDPLGAFAAFGFTLPPCLCILNLVLDEVVAFGS